MVLNIPRLIIWIVCGRPFLILEVITLDFILVSTFTNKIGHQFSLIERSHPFFSVSTITACFCNVDNSPLSEHSLARQIKESLIRGQNFCKIPHLFTEKIWPVLTSLIPSFSGSKCQLCYLSMVEIWPLPTSLIPNFSGSKCQLRYLFLVENWPLSNSLIRNFSGSKCQLPYLFTVKMWPLSTSVIPNFSGSKCQLCYLFTVEI